MLKKFAGYRVGVIRRAGAEGTGWKLEIQVAAVGARTGPNPKLVIVHFNEGQATATVMFSSRDSYFKGVRGGGQ